MGCDSTTPGIVVSKGDQNCANLLEEFHAKFVRISKKDIIEVGTSLCYDMFQSEQMVLA